MTRTARHATPARGVRWISPEELCARWERGDEVEIVDVRNAVDFAECHVPMARSMPWDTLDPRDVMRNRRAPAGAPLYIICQIGKRSAEVCERFIDAGFGEVVNVEGGTKAWRAAKLPTEGHTERIRVRRQTQIATGGLVLAGAVLGFCVDPWFLVIPTVVGAGSIVAGVTNSCAMELFVASLPWNRRGSAAAKPAT